MAEFVHLGPTRHGVRRYGELLDRVVSQRAPMGRASLAGDGAETGEGAATLAGELGAPVTHLQFSDHLVSVDDFEKVVGAVRAGRPQRRIVATVHDCPGVGHDGPELDARRFASYARVAALVDAVVVCSEHERRALREGGVSGVIAVIAHLVEERTAAPRPAADVARRTVGVLGFVYPGKGHDRVIAACARSERSPELVVLGGASSGHDDLVDELTGQANARGVACRVTGWLDEGQLDRCLASVEVPVVAHHAPSASGSLATWLAAGRRPLVAASPYTCELDRRAPGAMSIYDPEGGPAGLARAIDRALDQPDTTWGPGPPEALRAPAIAAAHLELYRSLS